MKRYLNLVFVVFTLFVCCSICIAAENQQPDKQSIIALYNSNKLQEAYQLIASVPEEKRDAEMWLILANITQDYDKTIDSVFLLQKALEVDPQYYKAYYNLGLLYLNDNKLTKAIENFENALKYNKEFPYAYYNLGCCYLKDAEFRKAKNYFLKAIKIKSDEPSFYYNLALAYKKMNNEKMAQKALDAYNSLTKD